MLRGIASCVVVLLALGACVSPAAGHGTLLTPRSRNMIYFNGGWTATAGNGLGPRPFRPVGDPGVCGDPYQEYSPLSNVAGSNFGIQATYTAGQVVTFSVNIQVNHGGRFRFRLCNRMTNLDQGCFSTTLNRADNGRPDWYILSGAWGNPPTTVSMDYRLPAGYTCENGCTLQFEYFTYNTCLEQCDRAFCGRYADRANPITGQAGPLDICYTPGANAPEIFRNCADIRITGGGTTPRASPPPPTRVPPPPAGGSGCPTAPGQARADCLCRNRVGRFQDMLNQCNGGVWCFGSGAAYISCPAGTKYDVNLGGVCNWASQVACPQGGAAGVASFGDAGAKNSTAPVQPAAASSDVVAAVATP